jgi:glucan 1,3-beta-glucosidase
VCLAGSTAHFAIAASQSFEGPGVDNFYHQIQNIDVKVSNKDAMGLHWKVAQGTNLRNMTFFMDGADTAIFIENGGGGFIGDVTIKGGKTGLDIGGQQWMIRNLDIDGCTVMGINLRWNWLFTFIGTHLANMPEGFGGGDDDNPSIHGGLGDSLVGSVVLVDTTFENVKVGIVEKYPEMSALVMDRVTADGATDFIVKGPHSQILGGQSVQLYRQGYGYEEGEELFPFLRDIPNIDDKHGPSKTSMPPIRPDTPMETRGLPHWQEIPESAVVNALTHGCRGDGIADDTSCLQNALADATEAVFLPSGTYLVTETVHVPKGKMLLGDCWSEIQAKAGSPAFSNVAAPMPMISLGTGPGTRPTTLSNLMLTLGGNLPGMEQRSVSPLLIL